LETLGVDYIDESEVLTPADEEHHVDKWPFTTPFVCGARDLGEGLRRLAEGAAMIRTKGEAGTGNVVEAVRHMRAINNQIKGLAEMSDQEMELQAQQMRVTVELVREVAELGRFPVVNFAAGGLATPADAALMMALGCDGVFVGSGIFTIPDEAARAAYAAAIVEATTFWDRPERVAEASRGLGAPMKGIEIETLKPAERLASRGW